jgi:tetratricopeptide (TPR) repeat protein
MNALSRELGEKERVPMFYRVHSRALPNKMSARIRFLPMFVMGMLVFQGGSTASAQGSWVGESVLPVKPSKEITFGNVVQGKQVLFPFSGRWPIKVRDDREEWLRIYDGHREGWVHKTDFVLVRDAPAYFSRRLRANPKDTFALLMRGAGWAQKGEPDNAMKDFDECIRLSPTEAIFFNSRGNAWKTKKQYDKAIADYDEAIRLNPTYALAFRNRGDAWSEMKRYDKAIRDYNEAIRLDPRFALALCNRGDAWSANKEYAKAIVDYDEAIRLDPKFALALYGKACCYAAQGRIDPAIESLRQALVAGYRNFGHMAKDSNLDPIRNEQRYNELLKMYAK